MPKIFVRLSVLFHFFHSFILLLLPTKPFQNNEIKKPQIITTNNKNNKKAESDLRRVFDTFDADKDGLITREELSTSLHKMGIPITDADLADLIEAADANADGCVDADEFEALYSVLTSSSDKEEEEHMKEAFKVFDRDGDGFISEEELKLVLESLGICNGRSLGECRKMIQRVDVDGDGRVCFSEFRTMMKGVQFANLNAK